MSFSDVTPGTPIIASNVQQVIDALKGTAGKGVPLTVSAVSDSARYALTLENTEATNSRALNVLKNDGSVLIRADATGVTLGAPLNLPTGSVTSTAILDGTIATADLANNAVTNAKLGTDTARLNLLVNGGFEIWQRGNGPFVSAWCADRWQASGAALSVSKDVVNTDTPGACAAATATGATLMYQVLSLNEGSWANLLGKTLSFSARVRTSTANAVRLSIYDSVNSLRYGSYHTGSGAYQTLTVTAPIAAGATGTIQLSVHFDVASTAYVDSAMLVVGSVPADYAPLHPADDLARCLRYYEVMGQTTNSLVIGGAYASAAGQSAYFNARYAAVKAVTPTVTVNGTWNLSNASAKPTTFGIGLDGCSLYVNSAAAGTFFASNNTAGQNITLESNP